MTKYILKKKTDLVELSDVFRRQASFGDKAAARKLVKAARRVACLSTYYYGEYPNSPMNDNADAALTKEVIKLAELAASLKIRAVVLPLSGDRRSWIGRRVRKNVLDGLSLPVKVTLQSGYYKKNMAAFGRINGRIKTALDIGLRGVADIDDRIKNTWDQKF